jgi:hypothetical protein
LKGALFYEFTCVGLPTHTHTLSHPSTPTHTHTPITHTHTHIYIYIHTHTHRTHVYIHIHRFSSLTCRPRNSRKIRAFPTSCTSCRPSSSAPASFTTLCLVGSLVEWLVEWLVAWLGGWLVDWVGGWCLLHHPVVGWDWPAEIDWYRTHTSTYIYIHALSIFIYSSVDTNLSIRRSALWGATNCWRKAMG